MCHKAPRMTRTLHRYRRSAPRLDTDTLTHDASRHPSPPEGIRFPLHDFLLYLSRAYEGRGGSSRVEQGHLGSTHAETVRRGETMTSGETTRRGETAPNHTPAKLDNCPLCDSIPAYTIARTSLAGLAFA